MPTYMLTGAAGFIASNVARQLLESGNSVVGVDNLNEYYDVNLKKHRLQSLDKYQGFVFCEKDIEDVLELSKLFDQHEFDAIINLAARAGVRQSISNPAVYLSTNSSGTLNLLELSRNHGVKKFVLASTSSLYAGQDLPFIESLPVNHPVSPYAASKKSAEIMAYSYHHLYGIDVSIVRYFTVYGPAGRPDMSIFRFISQIDRGEPITIYGDGTQTRDFTFVDDIARGTVCALKPVGYEIINLGGGKQPVSLKEVIGMIESELGKKATIRIRDFHEADLKSTRADISKAGELLNWMPMISLQEGISRTVEWYKANLPWSSEIDLVN